MRAAFLPTLGMPGMLSEGSPSSALISATKSGPRPSYRSATASMSYTFTSPNPEYMSKFVCALTSCSWSASPERIKDLTPVASAFRTIVPTKSSAS